MSSAYPSQDLFTFGSQDQPDLFEGLQVEGTELVVTPGIECSACQGVADAIIKWPEDQEKLSNSLSAI